MIFFYEKKKDLDPIWQKKMTFVKQSCIYQVQWNLDLRKPDLRKNLDLRKIVGTTDFLVH